MGLLDKLRGRGSDQESEKDEKSSDEEPGGHSGAGESLPGGASGGEAAEASNPQRAAELAD
jgi:hypothetical protein